MKGARLNHGGNTRTGELIQNRMQSPNFQSKGGEKVTTQLNGICLLLELGCLCCSMPKNMGCTVQPSQAEVKEMYDSDIIEPLWNIFANALRPFLFEGFERSHVNISQHSSIQFCFSSFHQLFHPNPSIT